MHPLHPPCVRAWLKHVGEFFVLRNADFVKFRNNSELSWENVLLIREFYTESK